MRHLRKRLRHPPWLLAAMLAATVTGPGGFAAGLTVTENVEITNLGPANLSFPLLGTVMVGDTVYVGSRNLSPPRVAGFTVSIGEVEQAFELGDGVYVQSLASDGNGGIYAGLSRADVNLYHIDLRTGEVRGVAAIPDQSVATLAVASDGTVYASGRPENGTRGPALFACDPKTGALSNLGVPRKNAGQSLALAVTDTTVYFGCGASSAGGGSAGLFTFDRETGEFADILPPELAGDSGINEIAVFDDLLVVAGSQVGVMDLAAQTWRITRVGSRQHRFARVDDALFVASSGGIHRIDLESWNVVGLGDPGAGLGDHQGMWVLGERIAGAMSGGHLWLFDPVTGATEVHDLVETGAPGGGEAGQSIGAVAEKVYVGGNNSVAVHDLGNGGVSKLRIPGEVKDMIAVGNTIYMATYAPAALWEHRPFEESPPRLLGRFPSAQNRPHVLRWDEVNELVVIGVRSDRGGGSLCFFDPATGDITVNVNPLGSGQWVWNVAPAKGLVYLAGANPGGRSGDLAAWDPARGEEVWRMEEPFGEGGGVSSLVAFEGRLFGVTIGGPRLFVIDPHLPDGPKIVHEGDLSAFVRAPTPLPRLVVDRGVVYGVSSHAVFRIDPETFEPEFLVSGLQAEWFSGPRLAVDDDGLLYTLMGRDLIQVRTTD